MARQLLTALLLLSLATSLSAAGWDRGVVLLETRSSSSMDPAPAPLYYDLWEEHAGWKYALSVAWILLVEPAPFLGEGHFLVPAPNQVVFHYCSTCRSIDGRTANDTESVMFWDGVARGMNEPKSWFEVFADDTDLGEIAPLRSGNFLVPERSADPARGARLIEFNTHGRVRDYAFPVNVVNGRTLGATHVEVLADQCTILYTTGSDDPNGNRIRRLNICTGQPMSDFATLVAGHYAGAIRQLPNGHVLVANGDAVFDLGADGSIVRTYLMPDVTHIALTTDAESFWAAGARDGVASLVHFDPSVPDGNPQAIPLGNPEMQTILVPYDISDLVVVGEWRASSPLLRSRAVLRR